ncbi:MAG: lycopene cyclase domain-containing protein [Bdellovibrionales bacterium]|nr:lycopene cyclase domain-containing protein [Bdellovibrionales bacterium]
MTYLLFHCLFTIPLFVFLVLFTKRVQVSFDKKSLYGMLTLIFLAVSYTTPWDSYLIKNTIWDYPPERVIGTFLYIPFEEYFFFVIQTIIGCLFTFHMIRTFSSKNRQPSFGSKTFFALVSLLLLTVITLSIPKVSYENAYRYIRLILAWASPIILLQWVIGFKTLWNYRQVYAVALTTLSLYFCVADWIAVKNGIWFFPKGQITEIAFFTHLPLEEALFFLCTNIMVVQGFILFTRMPLPWQKEAQNG